MKRDFAEPEARAEFPSWTSARSSSSRSPPTRRRTSRAPRAGTGRAPADPRPGGRASRRRAGTRPTDKRRPLRIFGHFNQQLWLAIRGVAGSLPFQAESDEPEPLGREPGEPGERSAKPLARNPAMRTGADMSAGARPIDEAADQTPLRRPEGTAGPPAATCARRPRGVAARRRPRCCRRAGRASWPSPRPDLKPKGWRRCRRRRGARVRPCGIDEASMTKKIEEFDGACRAWPAAPWPARLRAAGPTAGA